MTITLVQRHSSISTKAFRPDRVIRILELLPGSGNQVLSCRLHFINVDDGFEYLALSYVWGDPTQESWVMCNTKSLRITPNLWNLLHQLRNAHKAEFLWADAICIDQSNVAERSQQVRLMGDIYAKASGVVVWLGVKDSRSQAAFVGIKTTVRMMVENLQFAENYGGYSSSDLDAFDELKPGERSMTLEILRFFENPWFSRVWVLQEVGLASKVIVMCGSELIDWNNIGSMAMFLRKKEKLLLEHLNCSAVVNKVFHLYLTFQKSFEDIRNKFLYVLDNTRPYLAEDPRDKVYALLAHRTAQTKHGKSFIEPDYSKSLLEVYRDLTLRMIECDSSIEVLSAVQHDPDLQVIDDDFPSWVPRWDQHYNCRMLGRYTDKHFAEGNSEAVITPTENINILRVQRIHASISPAILASRKLTFPP